MSAEAQGAPGADLVLAMCGGPFPPLACCRDCLRFDSTLQGLAPVENERVLPAPQPDGSCSLFVDEEGLEFDLPW